MNLKEMLAAIATPLLRVPSGPLREMPDAELASAIATLEERVSGGERLVARLQPELELSAAESFAGADLASVEGNATAVRRAEAALTMHRTTLAGLRGEVERRLAENVTERAERRRKTAELAAATYVDAAKRMDAALAEFVQVRGELHTARESVWRALPQKGRVDFYPELLLAAKIDNQITNRLCGLTNGQLIRPKGLLSPTELAQQPGLGDFVAPIQRVLGSVVFNGDEE